MNKKILISTSSFGECGPTPMEQLIEAGMEISKNPKGRRLTAEEVVSLASGCIGMIAGVEPLTESVLKQLPDLKCISRCGVGMENVDLEAAKRLGILVLNTPDAPTQSVAELTIGLMLNLLRKITLADASFHKREWKKETGFLLSGKVVGILGMGRIGRKVTELLKPFQCRIITYDPQPNMTWLKENNVQLVSLDELLQQSDLVTVHVSHPSDAPPLLGAKEFASFKKGSWLLNLSRGNVIDENALFQALTSGHLGGAALDVFIEEPYSGPLCSLPNVIGTPHIASYAREAKGEMELQAVKNLLHALKS